MDAMGLLIFLLLGWYIGLSDSMDFLFCSDDWARVQELLGNSTHQEAWIGLYDDWNSWRWSLNNKSLHEQDLGSWFNLVADNASGNEFCAKIYQGKLNDRPCDVSPHFMCYDEPSNSYIPFEIKKDWQSARSYCRQTYTDLANIRTQQEFDVIKSVLPSANGHYWVGLFREGWKWSDQSGSAFRLWGLDEPSGGPAPTCGMAAVGGWNAILCSEESPFICTAPQMKVLKVTLKTDGSVNLNDPLVQAAVVRQMQRDVRVPGVHQEFSLRWRKQSNGDVFNKTGL